MSRALRNGLTRHFFELTDISTKQDLLAALGENIQGRIIDGYLWVSGAGQITISQEDGEAELQKYFPGAISIIPLLQDHELLSLANKAIQIQSDTAIDVAGHIDVMSGSGV
jgi:hypothetical protein